MSLYLEIHFGNFVNSLSTRNLETSSKGKSVFTNSRMNVLKVCADTKALIEIGFITNSKQENAMQDDAYLKSVGYAIANGIIKYYGYTNMIH